MRRLNKLRGDCLTCIAALRRGYFYWIDQAKVAPDDGPLFSSSVPSERQKNINEYGLSPLFGSRISALRIGSTMDAAVFYRLKPKICRAIEAALQIPCDSVDLGMTERLRRRYYYPKQNRQRFSESTPNAATCLCDVHFPENWDVEEIAVFSDELQRIVEERRSPELVRLGVTFAEDPPSDPPAFLPVGPDALSRGAAEEVEERWGKRVQDVARDLAKPIEYPPVTPNDVAEKIWEQVREAEAEETDEET